MAFLNALLLGTTALFASSIKSSGKNLYETPVLSSCRRVGDVQNVLKTRTFDGLSHETQDLIRLITLDKKTFPVGSFKYKAHRYPGDIDIFEPVKACCTEESASEAIANKLKTLAKEISKRKSVYLGDFKAGLDHRYYLAPNTNPKLYLDRLRKQDLLTADEYQEGLTLRGENLDEFVRRFYVIRWNLEELVAGIKTLRGNVTLTLADALRAKTIVKIDLWAPINGNYNETTNFFLIIMIDEQGNEKVLNQELGDRLISLNGDIVKYGGAHKNSLKLAKRLWNRALYVNDRQMYNLLYPLFQSGANSLNQIAGESEVIRMMLTKLVNPPTQQLYQQIDGFKRRIEDVFDMEFDAQPMYQLIDDIVQREYDPIEGLSKLESMIRVPIETFVSKFLECRINVSEIVNDAQKELAKHQRAQQNQQNQQNQQKEEYSEISGIV